MLRLGLLCFALCLGTVVTASILDKLHFVVFGPARARV